MFFARRIAGHNAPIVSEWDRPCDIAEGLGDPNRAESYPATIGDRMKTQNPQTGTRFGPSSTWRRSSPTWDSFSPTSDPDGASPSSRIPL